MYCPFCSKPDTKVLDSRVAVDTNAIRRRRECSHCGGRFTTYEMAEVVLPRVIKNDNSRVTFDQQRIRRGMLRALEKRPVSTERVEQSISQVLNKARSYSEKELPTSVIGEWIMAELKDLDEVAFVRFASVYRRFQDLEAFNTEIQKLLSSSIK